MAADKPNKKPIIRCQKNGPYVVKDLNNLSRWDGTTLPTFPTMSLCRCGQSKSMPDCDGTHVTIGFDSKKTTDGEWDFREDYVGKQITIHDNRGICAHSGFCTDGLPSVWKIGVEPWIDPDGASVEEIVETIKKCPSGALSYSIEDVEHRDQDRDPAVQLAKDGPFWVVGGAELQNEPRGEEASLEHYTLCRCGGSKNKPFCDGTHWHINFKDEEAMPEETERGNEVTPEKPTLASDNSADDDGWVRVAEADEIADGQIRSATVGGKAIVITHYDGEFGALDAKCPHQRGPLDDGSIEGGLLRCPWHGWGFDPLTGEVVEGGMHDVASYPVEVRDGGVYVRAASEEESVVTISDVMIETMVNWGVTHVFGIVGHSNLGVADAVRRQATKGALEYIGVRHEGAASFAASAYAKLSGKPAACLTIAGPGATNLLTGLWDAKMDRAPVLALTGQVNTQVLGPGAFQEIDLSAAFRSVATWSQTVLPTSNHAELMNLALKHAIVKRDVSHLIFPDEVQRLGIDPDQGGASDSTGRISPTAIAPPVESLKRAVARIAVAKRPSIIVGYGAKTAMDRVIELAERLRAPIITTFKAKGQISDRHPHAAGVLGRSGTPVAATSMNEADLLIVFGASFSVHTGISQAKPTIQVDSERLALGKSHPVEVPVWGDIGVTVELLLKQLPAELAFTDQLAELAGRWAKWREEKERRATVDHGRGVNSAAIFAALSRQAPANAVIAVDVGNNTYSFGRYFECRNHMVLMSGYLGSIGFGFPAAMGACAAAPGKSIIAVTGDGGFSQYLAEFTTAVKYGMNITTILVNNGEFGKISSEQKAIEMPVWQTDLHNPNFAEFARNCGGYGVRVTRIDELDDAMTAAIVHMGPAIVEIMADGELT